MFFGREELIEQLESLWGKSVSSLVTCRGRRRVGKSTLIEEFANHSKGVFIKIEGRKPEAKLSNEDELATFAKQLSKQTKFKEKKLADWSDAFAALSGQIHERSRTVVLLDEVSWLAHYDESFADYLKMAWDNDLKKHSRLVLVLCGSVSTWIKDNIIDNSAYKGRRSLDLVVPELPLKECVKFWGKQVKRLATREIIDVLSVTGGIPRYLEEINPRLSAEENIRRLCYLPKSVLREDFDEMFLDVITQKPKFTAKVLRCLVEGPKSCTEVNKKLKIGKGGNVSKALKTLEEAGLVAPECKINPETGEPIREIRYRLKDNYARFYLKFVEPHKGGIDDGSFKFTTLKQFDGIDAMMGLAFENLVVNNYAELVPHLRLTGSMIKSAGPYRRFATKGPRGKKGCQVDLLIQTPKALCFVEVKRQKEIDKDVIKQVDAQVNAIPRKSCVSAKTALVYDGELSPVVPADDYFDTIIPFRALLGID